MVRGLPVEDRLDGASNYGSWKTRVLIALEEYDVVEFAVDDIPKPTEEDQERLASWKRHDVKARKILIDSVKSHLLFHISKAATAKEMFDILKKLFERDSTSKSIALRSQLHTLKMKKSESVDSYFARIAEIKNQLGNAGEVIPDKELSIYIVRGLPNSWETFVQTVTGRDTLPSYDRLWSDCTEEEARLMAKNGETREEDQALAARWKGKKKRQFHQKNHGDRSNYRSNGRPNYRSEGRSNNWSDRRFDNRRFDRRSDRGRQDRRTDTKDIQCFGCEGYGHMKKDCPSVQQSYRSDRR